MKAKLGNALTATVTKAMPGAPIRIVMTADVVASTDKKAKKLEAVLTGTAATIERKFLQGRKTFHFSRGDSFQALLPVSADAIRMAVSWRAGLVSKGMDLRLSLAAGEVTHIGKSTAHSSGEAFIHSGRMLDKLKDGGDLRMWISAGEGAAKAYFEDTTMLADALIRTWTAMQAEAVFEVLLHGETQEALAKRLKITQPAVHKRLVAAHWPSINRWITGCGNLLAELYPFPAQ